MPSGNHSDASAASASHLSFLSAANVVCQQAVRAHAGHPFPVQGFDPLHPDPSKLPAVGDYFARNGGLPGAVDELHGLTPPAADAAQWQALLAIADAMVANAQEQIAAARAQDVPTFVQTVRAVDELTTRMDTAGQEFGFTPQSPCSQVFG